MFSITQTTKRHLLIISLIFFALTTLRVLWLYIFSPCATHCSSWRF